MPKGKPKILGLDIEHNAFEIKRLNDLVPGEIFKMAFCKEGKLKLIFISEGIQKLIPGICPEKLKENPKTMLSYIYVEDRDYVYELL
ncbi:hypothetical protein [Pleomorphovibrio marinus]|uniref:hypothetical protein n=1 Tax=Pleomorphovibrio marinus TaxID=2164132 RepID=UPI000E0A4B77|nr:hypothetical protein [Pleomorphovibrio marinus]